jgi:hypothetical protein
VDSQEVAQVTRSRVRVLVELSACWALLIGAPALMVASVVHAVREAR